MGKYYDQLSTSERNQLQRSLNAGMSLRAIARSTGRSVSTLSAGNAGKAAPGRAMTRWKAGRGRVATVAVAHASCCLETP